MKKLSIITVLLLTFLGQIAFSQKEIQLYQGRPKGSENWTWKEQLNVKNMFGTEVIYNVSQPTITAY